MANDRKTCPACKQSIRVRPRRSGGALARGGWLSAEELVWGQHQDATGATCRNSGTTVK